MLDVEFAHVGGADLGILLYFQFVLAFDALREDVFVVRGNHGCLVLVLYTRYKIQFGQNLK